MRDNKNIILLNKIKNMKMYSLSCKDLGVGTCNYVAMGETKEEVIEMTKEHGMKAHPKEMKENMEKMSKEEMEDMMMEKIIEKDDEEEM